MINPRVRDLSYMAGALLVSIFSIIGAGCGGAKPNAQAAAPPPPAVVLADVEQRTVPIFSEFVGQTKAFSKRSTSQKAHR